MRLDRLALRHSSPVLRNARAIEQPTLQNPYHDWLNTLAAGAICGFAAFLIDAGWSFAILASRVRGQPTQRALAVAHPTAAFAMSAIQWLAIWLLTTDNPTPYRSRRVRAISLRLIATISLVATFVFVLHLFDDVQIVVPQLFAILSIVDLVVAILLFTHLRWLAARIDLRGASWRAIVAMIGYSTTIAVIVLWPRISTDYFNVPVLTTRMSHNVRFAMLVLWSAICAMVMLRFAIGFRSEIRKSAPAFPLVV